MDGNQHIRCLLGSAFGMDTYLSKGGKGSRIGNVKGIYCSQLDNLVPSGHFASLKYGGILRTHFGPCNWQVGHSAVKIADQPW